MRQHIGVDIIEIDRIRKVTERRGQRFLERVFTAAERDRYRGRFDSLAARFAAKEAILKCLDACHCGVRWQDIEVLSNAAGKPTINLKGAALAAARRLALVSLDVSLSHSENYAVAFACGTGDGGSGKAGAGAEPEAFHR